MSRRALERELRSLRAPDEGEAALRAWDLASAEFDRREAVPAARRLRTRRLLPLAFTLVCAAALGISPAGAGVVRWVGNRFDSKPGVRHARPALVTLPASGSLIVRSRDAVWVVGHDGLRRRLGRYSYPVWSPHGLFVAAVRGDDLVAMEPNGRVHWSLPRVPAPRRPSWSPDGFRIAYLSGHSLRVVVGNGAGDRLLARHVPGTPPVWRPGPGHVLAYVRHGGRLVVADADLGTTLWRSAGGIHPTQLAWAPDGSRLLSVEPQRLLLFDAGGRPARATLELPQGEIAQAVAFSPDGRTIALLRFRPASGRSDLVLLSARGRRWHPRVAFSRLGRFGAPDWSPDGRWLLLPWRDADQWLFIPTAPGRRMFAVANVASAFEPGRAAARFPTLGGWCCAR